MNCGQCWGFNMEVIEYKKPFGQTSFLVVMCLGLLVCFYSYYSFDRDYLFTPRPILASLFIPFAVAAVTIGVKKITFDGKQLRIQYGFGYRRIYPIEEIEKITFEDRPEYSGVVVLFYLKNGEKFSRGLTGGNAKPFAEKLKAHFT